MEERFINKRTFYQSVILFPKKENSLLFLKSKDNGGKNRAHLLVQQGSIERKLGVFSYFSTHIFIIHNTDIT